MTDHKKPSERRYGWLGRPGDDQKCAGKIPNRNGTGQSQCTSRPGFGPNELYCLRHAFEAARIIMGEGK